MRFVRLVLVVFSYGFPLAHVCGLFCVRVLRTADGHVGTWAMDEMLGKYGKDSKADPTRTCTCTKAALVFRIACQNECVVYTVGVD